VATWFGIRAILPEQALGVTVNTSSGKFQGSLTGAENLLEDHLYALRVRQQDTSGKWSSWSDWNTSLRTGLCEPRAR